MDEPAAAPKNLTRRANHRHIFSIAGIQKPPRPNRLRFLCIGRLESGDHCRHISLVPPQFRCPVARAGLKDIAMKKLLVGALIAGSFFSFEARAQERAGSAALGAMSGAVVLGPIGAVAGAFIGYTAGPSIARSWGMQRSSSRSRARHTTQSRPARQQQAAAATSSPPSVRTSPLPAKRAALPPVQGFE